MPRQPKFEFLDVPYMSVQHGETGITKRGKRYLRFWKGRDIFVFAVNKVRMK